jgi:hypothetical protein
MIDVNETRRMALWQAIEDYSGLWELLWEMHTVDPEGDPNNHAEQARAAVHELVDRGWIEPYYCQEPYGDMIRIPQQAVASVLANPLNWDAPPKNGQSVRISATAIGEKAYRQLEKSE